MFGKTFWKAIWHCIPEILKMFPWSSISVSRNLFWGNNSKFIKSYMFDDAHQMVGIIFKTLDNPIYKQEMK